MKGLCDSTLSFAFPSHPRRYFDSPFHSTPLPSIFFLLGLLFVTSAAVPHSHIMFFSLQMAMNYTWINIETSLKFHLHIVDRYGKG